MAEGDRPETRYRKVEGLHWNLMLVLQDRQAQCHSRFYRTVLLRMDESRERSATARRAQVAAVGKCSEIKFLQLWSNGRIRLRLVCTWVLTQHKSGARASTVGSRCMQKASHRHLDPVNIHPSFSLPSSKPVFNGGIFSWSNSLSRRPPQSVLAVIAAICGVRTADARYPERAHGSKREPETGRWRDK